MKDVLTEALQAAQAAADGASQILMKHFGHLQNVTEKFQAGLVSEADKESEDFILGLLKQKFPTHKFLGEETGFTSGSLSPGKGTGSDRKGAIWMIDPLDGTTNYVHGFPVFCVSIGLEVDGELAVAVIDAPMLRSRYHAVRGQGAFLNGQPIRASSRTEFKDGLFATGFSSNDDSLEMTFDLLSVVIKRARGIRRAGAAALDLCFVAQGVFDCFWEKNLSAWDTAAGALIAMEAGARVTDMTGRPFDPREGSILAGTPAIHQQVLQMYTQIRGQ